MNTRPYVYGWPNANAKQVSTHKKWDEADAWMKQDKRPAAWLKVSSWQDSSGDTISRSRGNASTQEQAVRIQRQGSHDGDSLAKLLPGSQPAGRLLVGQRFR